MTFGLTAFRNDIPATVVHVRASWADDWVAVPYLHVESLGYSVGGAFGSAMMRYEYGRIQREGTTAFAAYVPLAIDRYYVRIAYTPNNAGSVVSYWYGVIISSTDEPLGTSLSMSAGNQSLTAVTLDWLLTQKQMTASWVASGSGKQEIDRAIAFNGGDGETGTTVENKSSIPGPDGVPVFSEKLINADLWTAADILEYLIEYYPPHDGNGPPWSINGTVRAHLDWFSPRVPCEGRTLYTVIDSLIDSRRGLAWYVDSSSAGCEINVASYSPTTISLSDDKSIPANSPNTVTLDGERQVGRVVTVTDSQDKYSSVRVTGARRGCCFTVGTHDNTLVSDWSSTDEAMYKQGDPTAATKTLAEDKAKHDTYRSSDYLRHVYTRFRLPNNWDGWAGNGTDFPASYVCPFVDSFTGDIAGSGVPFWQDGLRFKKKLPLREFHDYRSSVESPVDNTPTGATADYLDSFAIANISGTRVMTHELQAWSNNEIGPAGGTEMASNLEVLPNAAALYVRPQSMPHAQADGEFDMVVDGSDTPTIFTWLALICTVFVEWDAWVEATYPQNAAAEINDIQSEITIQFGDRARMDYVAKGTVLGVEEGNLVMATQDGFVRNDHPILRDVARLAWQWYSESRKAIRMTVQHVSNELEVGDLLGTVDGDTVNSLVTSVRYDFGNGTTDITTQFANIDPRALVG